MTNTTNFTCRIDNDVKNKSEAVFNELGTNLSTAINVFLRESIRSGGFPFDVRLNTPNKETITAMMKLNKYLMIPL